MEQEYDSGLRYDDPSRICHQCASKDINKNLEIRSVSCELPRYKGSTILFINIDRREQYGSIRNG